MECFGCFGTKTDLHDREDATKVTIPLNPTQPESIERKEIVSRPTYEDTYDNNNSSVGIALIFNHKHIKNQKDRNGTEIDCANLKNALLSYGFDVRVYQDLSFADVHETLKKTASEDHTNNDCLVLAIMSHGDVGKVYARDMSYPVERLWNPFLGENCKSLINKPKLFFIQACRGRELERPVTYSEFSPMSRNAVATNIVTYAVPNTADMLVMYSTFENHYSFRNPEYGSWFIRTLCEVLNAAAKEGAATPEGADLLHLLTAVNRRVAYEYQSNTAIVERDQMKEMPNFMSTLTKLFYLKVKTQKPEIPNINEEVPPIINE